MSDIRRMQLGQVVDYCIAYNERQNQPEEKQSARRKATQNDINAFFG